MGLVALCYAIALKLFHDRNLALNASLILVLATFSWEYSQAAWPHATATFFLMAAFYIYICALYSKTIRVASFLALASGLIAGFAVGIRLDSIFVFPCLILPFLFQKPWRPWCAFAVCIGALPGLSLLSVTNYIKFGTFSFLSYGRSVEYSMGLAEIKLCLSFAGLITGVIAILWILNRDSIGTKLHPYKRQAIIGVFFLAVALITIPQVQFTIGKVLNGTYQLIVDLRVRELGIKEGALTRSGDGGMVYIGGLKKSLLQSCPYLVVLLFPFLRIVRRERDAEQLTILFLIPLVFISFFSYHNAWHGGLSLNLRYFIPILPFTSILSAYAWRELAGALNLQWSRLCLLTTFMFTILFLATSTKIDHQEFPFLTLPLLLALLLIILLILREKFAKTNGYMIARTTITTFFVAMVWSCLVAFLYDFPRAYWLRQYNLKVANSAAEVVSDNSILFTNDYDAFSGLIEIGRVRIACPARDNFYDFPELITFHLQKGHPVYTAFSPLQWEKIREKGLLDSFKVVPIEFDQNYNLSQLTIKTGL
jgi:hypothetical protein